MAQQRSIYPLRRRTHHGKRSRREGSFPSSRAAMALQQQSPPEKKAPPLPTTTISALDQGTLCEIFLRLPSLASLVRVAFACRTFLDAVRSSPAFRRRFSALHQPPLLGAFHSTDVMPTFLPLHGRSDPDLAAAVRGADFFLTSLPVPDADEEKDPVYAWLICDCRDGCVLLNNWSTNQMAVYRPLARALDLFPLPPDEECKGMLTEFHVFSSEEDNGSFRVLCVCPEPGSRARAIVFSSDTRKWQIFPLADINGLCPRNGKLVNGCIYWIFGTEARVLNIATMQFSRMDLPPRRIGDVRLRAGETKDGRLCMVCEPLWSLGPELSLVVWFWRADDDGVEKWMLDKSLPLQELAEIVQCEFHDNVEVRLNVVTIIDGFVYLFAFCGVCRRPPSTRWFLSVCLETAVLNKLGRIRYAPPYPYIMAWPRSLVQSKSSSSK